MKAVERYRDPIRHAIECKDKVLLDRIELEIVRDLGIQPQASATNAPEEVKGWKAVGIVSVGRDLAVLWSSRHSEDCDECDGSGQVRAYGNKKSFDVECPDCWGSGKQDASTEYRCWSDLDGAKLEKEPAGPKEVDLVIGARTDPLQAYYIRNAKEKLTKEAA